MFISEGFEWKRSAAAIKVMCLEESNLEGYIVTSVENKQEIVC